MDEKRDATKPPDDSGADGPGSGPGGAADAAKKRKSSRIALWLAGGAVGFVVITALACGLGLYQSVSSFGEGRDGAEASLVPFVESLAAGDVHGAHARTTTRFGETTSAEDLRRLADEAQLSEYESLSIESWNVNNQWGGDSRARLAGTIRLRSGNALRFETLLVDADGESYRIDAFALHMQLGAAR